MKRTQFHKCLLSLAVQHDVCGIKGICKDTGIPYQTMQIRLRDPRGLRWYEYLNIAESLRLNTDEEAELQESIRAF